MTDRFRVEVAYARPESQLILEVDGEEGITVAEAIERSGITKAYPEINLDEQKVGIFGKATTLKTVLVEGDRVEIYRKLIADPKEARRKRAAEGKSLKNRAAKKDKEPAGE